MICNMIYYIILYIISADPSHLQGERAREKCYIYYIILYIYSIILYK